MYFHHRLVIFPWLISYIPITNLLYSRVLFHWTGPRGFTAPERGRARVPAPHPWQEWKRGVSVCGNMEWFLSGRMWGSVLGRVYSYAYDFLLGISVAYNKSSQREKWRNLKHETCNRDFDTLYIWKVYIKFNECKFHTIKKKCIRNDFCLYYVVLLI